jgi:hypothetical protein
VVGEQVKYRGIDDDFGFANNEKSKWKHYPYRGEKLF